MNVLHTISQHYKIYRYEYSFGHKSPSVSEAIVYAILARPNVIRLDPHFSFGLIEADKDDNKFVDCAIAANAKCIVTEDKHFEVLKSIPFPKVEVVGIDDFKMYLGKWLDLDY